MIKSRLAIAIFASTALCNAAFAQTAVNPSPHFRDLPADDDSDQAATMKSVQDAISARGFAPLTGGTFTGTVNVPNTSVGDSSAKAVNGASLQGNLAGYASLSGGTFTGTVSFTPPAASTVNALVTTQSLHGTVAGNISANTFTISSDDAQTDAQGILLGWNYNHSMGGFNLQGNHFSMQIHSLFTAADNNITTSPYFLAFSPNMTVWSADHGTDTTFADSRGGFQVMNPVLSVGDDGDAGHAAHNLNNMAVAEFNISCAANCSTASKLGLSIVALGTDKTQGTQVDVGFAISAVSGAVGWKDVFCICSSSGAQPFNSSSTLMLLGSGGTADTIVDSSLTTATSYLWKAKYMRLTESSLVLGDTSGSTIISAAGGPGAAANMLIRPGGTGGILFQNNGTGGNFAEFDQGGTPADYPVFVAGASGANAIGFSVAGSDTNIDIAITPKGTGAVTLPTVATGTPVASVCVDSSKRIIMKTTTGACI